MSDASKIIAFKRRAPKTEAAAWPGFAGYPRFDQAFAPAPPTPKLRTLQSVPANDARPH